MMSNPLDAFVPRYLFRENHELRISQPPDLVWRALMGVSAAELPMVRALMRLRGMSSRGGGSETVLAGLSRRGWFELAKDPGRLVIMGSIGQFWRPGSQRRFCPADDFPAHEEDGYAKSASAFELVPAGTGTLLRTETRVAPAGNVRFRMGAYWLLIRPFSGLIRRMILHAVAGRAGRLAGTSSPA
ncbi:hypothetical protein ACIBHY_09730 [Nonomuraea sp. NPDC050547]|uniref:hypothetical protein n=1 Tax=unclassified Nonomuraea TaxID=2593643 RepID=UPI00379D74EF